MNRRRLGLAFATALVAHFGASCKTTTSSGRTPGCDAAGLEKVISALKTVEPEQRSLLAGVGIAEACTAAMPKGLSTALMDSGRVGPEHRSMVAMRALAAEPVLWTQACTGGVKAAQELGMVAPDERPRLLAERCQLDRHGYATAGELTGVPMETVVLAALSYEWLHTDGADAAMSKTLARALLGLR